MATTSLTARPKRIGAITAVLMLVGGGIAFAYWTTSGSGSGTAATGTDNAVTIVQTSSITAMAPGVAPQTLSGTFTNPNSGPVYVDSISVTVSSVTQHPDSVALGDCEADDYVIAGSPMQVDAEVPADDTGTWSGATIAFNNSTTENQDGCKNATVSLAYTSN